jgi:AsmA protein
MKLRVKSPHLEVSYDGRVGASDVLQLQGRMDLAMSDVRQTARWLGAPWPSGPGLQNASIKGDFDWQGQALSFDKATFRMDGNEATGTLALSFSGQVPAVTGTLALQTLDLSPYVSKGSDGLIAALFTWVRSDDDHLAAPIGRHLDADIRASAARVLAGGMEFGRFAASLSLKQGRLLADVAEVGVDGGRASGQLTADFGDGQPQLAVRGRLEDIDASRATTALLGHSAVQGLSTITADVSAAGSSAPDLLSALRGKVTLSLNEGGKLGIDVKSLLDAAHKGGVDGWQKATRGQTSVDGLEAKLRLDKGIVASELVEATVGDSLLRAIGTVSLKSRQMDLRVLLDAAPESARRDLPRDVLVFRGPWSAPSIVVER